jgi:TonB family protein
MSLKKILLLSVAVILAMPVASAQFKSGGYEELYDGETVSSLKKHVRNLSAAHLEGRKAGSEGEKMAAEYVAATFREYGLDLLVTAAGEEFGMRTESGDTLTSRNVLAVVEGYDKKLRDQIIVVGARLDNLGTMTVTVDGKPVEKIYYGANGNASGLAVLLELSRMVRTNAVLFRRSVVFAAFGSSLESYAGAWYFLNREFKSQDRIDAMINLDMLGTGYNGFYAYTASNTDLNTLVSKLSGELQPIQPQVTAAEPYPSDHRAFYAAEIPSVMFTTGRYPERNTEKDMQSILDYDNMERELEYIYNFTLNLANQQVAPLFRNAEVPARDPSYDDVVSYHDCDIPPMFLNSTDPGKFLKEWVYKYIKYPEVAIRDGVQGRVMVDFIIDKDGKVTDVRVLRSVSEELDAEAVKVVSASPKWKPGRMNGNKVRTSMTIPVEFRLEKNTGKASFGIRK